MISTDKKNGMIGEWSITVLLTGIILLLVVPLLLGAFYTYPAADDFIVENGSMEWAEMSGTIWGHFLAAWNYYMTWEGRYTSNLLLFTILPFTRFGLNGFRVSMVLWSLFFVLSLFFMVNGIVSFLQPLANVDYRCGGRNKKLFLYAVLLFATLGLPGTWIGREIFYWYTGAVGYLSGICSLFLSMGYFFLANSHRKKQGKRYYIGSALFGFIAAGTCPQVASFVCSWHLIVLLVVILSVGSVREWFHFENICPFVVSFLGTIINVAAPGSQRRSKVTMDAEGVSYGLMDAVKDTFVCQKKEFTQILQDPFFIALMIMLFLVCIYFDMREIKRDKKISGGSVLIIICSVLVSQFLCIFPVVLGYHGKGLYNERTKYTAEFEIRFSFIFAIIYMARYVSRKLAQKEKCNKIFYLTAVLGGVLICIAGFWGLNNYMVESGYGYSFELIRELSDETVQEVYFLRKEVLDTLETAEDGSDVYLQMPSMPFTRVTYSQGIGAEPDEQTNQAVASMFHLNSVAVEYGVE